MNPLHKVADEFLTAMFVRDTPKMAAMLTDDAVWYPPQSAIAEYRGPHRGAKTIMSIMSAAAGGVFAKGTQRHETVYMVAEGDTVAVMLRQIAKFLDGRDYNNLYCFFLRIRDGKVYELWENLDTAYFYQLFTPAK